MTDSDAAREHSLHDDGMSEQAIHARIAQRLAAMSTDAGGAPPPPYARRHLARHAHLGGVLDDARVPPQALAWDTGGGISGLLHASPTSAPRRWLTAWSVVEPYLRDADLPSRLSSLHLAYIAMNHARTPRSRIPSEASAVLHECPVAAVWADWQPDANVLAVLPASAASLAVLPSANDGQRYVAVGTTDGSLYFLNTHTAQIEATQTAHTGEVRRLRTTAPDSHQRQYLISASTDGSLRLWDARAHTPLLHLPGTIWIDDTDAFYDAVGQLTILSINGRSELIQWTPPDPARLRSTEQRVPRGAIAALLDEHGNQVIAHAAHQLTLHTGRQQIASHPLTVPVWAIAVSAHQQGIFYCGHADGSITTWSAAHGPQPGTVPGHGEPVEDLTAFTLGGHDVVAAARGSRICLWQPVTGATTHLSGHRDSVTALATITDNPAAGTTATLLSTAHDATLRQWTADTLNDALLGNPRDLPARPAAAVLLKDTTLLAACADRDSIGLWDLQHGRRTPARTDAGVLALAWAERNGQPVLVWSDTTRTIRTWNPATDPHAGLTLDSQSRVRTLATCRTPHGACLLLGAGDDYRTRLWDLDSGSLLRTWHGHTMSVKATAAAAGSDGQIWLATGGTEGVVRLWDPDQPHHSSAEIHCDQGLISALAFSPEPTEGLPPFLATGGDQTPVRLWDLLTSSWLEQEFPGPATPAAALTTFTVNDRHSYVAAATHDGLVHIWHAASARRVLQIATGAPVTRLHARPQPAGHMVILAISGQAGVLVTALDFSHRALVH